MSWEYSRLDKNVTERWRKLGDVGEYIAEILLTKAGFSDIHNLNQKRRNNVYADIYAKRGSQAYVISVKTRNKYENTGRLNSRYKLGADCYEKAKIVETEYKAKAAWVTVAIDVDKGVYDAYFGVLSALNGNKGVLMTPEATSVYECLGYKGEFEKIGIPSSKVEKLKNIYKDKYKS